MRLNVDIVGVSTLARAYLTLLSMLIEKLDTFGVKNPQSKKIHVVAGDVIPQNHLIQLQNDGVSAIFSPESKIRMIINNLVNL